MTATQPPHSDPLTESGVYTAPDGSVYAVEVRDVVLRCGLRHEHDPDCYEPANGARDDR